MNNIQPIPHFIIGFGGIEIHLGDLVFIAHGQYMNIGILHRIVSETQIETLEMFGWYRHEIDGTNIRGFGRDGLLKTCFKKYQRQFFFRLAPAQFIENTEIGALFLRSAEHKLTKSK